MKKSLKALSLLLALFMLVCTLTSCLPEDKAPDDGKPAETSSKEDGEGDKSDNGNKNPNDKKEEPVPDVKNDGEEENIQISYVKYGLAFAGYAVVCTGYSEDGMVAAQTFFDATQNPESIRYCTYKYNDEGNLTRWTVYGNKNGYVQTETYRAEFTYPVGSNIPSSSRSYELGKETDEAATVTYHENGALHEVYLDDISDPMFLVSFDSQGRYLSSCDDGMAVTMIYGETENAAQAKIEGNDVSYWYRYADIAYDNGLLTRMSSEAGGTTAVFEYGYDANGLPNKLTLTLTDASGNTVGKEIYSSTLDTLGRVIEKSECTYGEGNAFESKVVERFEYNSKGYVTKEVTVKYSDENTVKQTDTQTTEYDSEYRKTKVEKLNQDGDGNVTSRYTDEYKYNEFGKVSENTYTAYNDDGSVKSKAVTTYTYDAGGELIDSNREYYTQ